MLLCAVVAGAALAASNMDPTNKFAWAENAGWLDFGPTNGGGVVVTNVGLNNYLSGYAWAENVGWISLGATNAPQPYANTASTNYGVNMNRTNGLLAGYAWGENCGWVNFAATNGGAVILDLNSGRFNGYAWSESVGWIHFTNATSATVNYNVQTSWRPDTNPPVVLSFAFTPTLFRANQSGVATVTVSEAVTGFDVTDVTVSGDGTLDAFTTNSASEYVVHVTSGPIDGTLSLAIASNAFSDLVGNLLASIVQVSAMVDATPPTASIALSLPNFLINQSGVATITVNEAVLNLEDVDVQVTGGTKGPLTMTDPTHYTVAVTAGPDAGTLSVTIPALAFTDLAGNTLAVPATATATITLLPPPVGNIDLGHSFAWAENAGWVNFSSPYGGVTVSPEGFLSGYAWAENVGWIKLGSGAGPYANNSHLNWGVNLVGAGHLTGYAWGENSGWINFSPTNGFHVSISLGTGDFSGFAWSESVGWIHFQNASPAYRVRTTVMLVVGSVFKIR